MIVSWLKCSHKKKGMVSKSWPKLFTEFPNKQQTLSGLKTVLRLLQFSTGHRVWPPGTWDHVTNNSRNPTVSRQLCGQPTVLASTRLTDRLGGSCWSVSTAAGFMTSTSWSCVWSNTGNIASRRSLMKRSGSGSHILELACGAHRGHFEHSL